ncbi:hypothetical protein SD457_21240 [Coprobacillaceae bacterium CR2/5/TPMF4]|nr:hypothetical protein SD457_21240 [Coprobacillaceae bacterium CR2/5/TPMF4]
MGGKNYGENASIHGTCLCSNCSKINAQRHVAAVRDAFTLSFPLTMAGSMVLLINNVFLDPNGFIASLLHLGI